MEKPIIEKAIRGTLKFLVFNRFYGFITRFDTREDIFVHGSEIRYINPMQFTRRCGDSVIFDLAVGVKGLEAVNVILNLAETSEGDLCDDNDGKDSIYLFDNLNGRFQKLAGSKPGLVVMKKRSKAPSSGLDDRGDPEQDTYRSTTADSFSLNTYPSMSSLSKYPSMSTLSSISYDDSILSWPQIPPATPEVAGPISNPVQEDTAETVNKPVDPVDDANVNGYDGTNGENEEMNIEVKYADLTGESVVETVENGAKSDPIVDLTNTFPDDRIDEDKVVRKTKLTMAELRGKSFKKMHEENMKRRLTLQP
ncbi:hypothetical protein M8J76_002879 [Diaphorina citri]|nr:hypothetical protein M8J75_009759 [Diaphorina citri]KAI5723205.1 hypothetical protein M8J76_002879 [Diaphorina citri]KAI5729030.1 hypothetical protein M8J77_024429 [Diaphorina citri]